MSPPPPHEYGLCDLRLIRVFLFLGWDGGALPEINQMRRTGCSVGGTGVPHEKKVRRTDEAKYVSAQ